MKIRSRRVVTSDGLREATVEIEGGKIAAITDSRSRCLDVGDSVIMPGLVDTHVHVNEPGRTEWEGFDTATRASAAGGITTIVDMPLNSIPPTTTVKDLRAKREAARGQCWIDFAFWGGLVPGNETDLGRMNVPGFKCFLTPSGVDEFPHVTERDLRAAMPVLAKKGATLLVHAEMDVSPTPASPKYADYLRSRPARCENRAIEMVSRLAREFGVRTHIVHLSSAGAKLGGVTAETCPHYLTFEAERIPDGATQFKCSPPIREASNRERLWRGLAEGRISMIVSDHSPCVPGLKPPGDFSKAWGGIASLQFSLPAVWTEASARGYTLDRLARWMSLEPARLAGLAGRKGAIAVGYDADLVVWNPEATFTVKPSKILHRHPVTPYAARKLKGVVEMTILRGRRIDEVHRTGRPCF